MLYNVLFQEKVIKIFVKFLKSRNELVLYSFQQFPNVVLVALAASKDGMVEERKCLSRYRRKLIECEQGTGARSQGVGLV